jgi:hypothetical protein
MKAEVYLETTIPSYLVARPSRDLMVAEHQRVTRDWWDLRRVEFELYTSELVLVEVRSGNSTLASGRLKLLEGIPVLGATPEIMEVGEDLIRRGAVPKKAARDAVHIAIATAYHCEYLLTWNCRHIANAELTRIFERVIRGHELEVPTLCTPLELMGESYEMDR